MIDHTRTEKIGDDSIYFCDHPSRARNRYDNNYTTIVNQLNQLGRMISEDELVKRLLMSLPKAWRLTIVVIREVKDLNKISLDEICGSLLTY